MSVDAVEGIVGHIIGGPADPSYDGAVLTTDLAVGDLVLNVDDVADFDEDAAERGAAVILGMELDDDGNLDPSTGTVLAYKTAYNENGVATYGHPETEHTGTPNTVELLAASTITASAGDWVYIQNPIDGLPVGSVEVSVAIDDADTTGDPLLATLDLALLASVGDVDLTDQAVTLDVDEDDQLIVAGFPGLARSQGDVKFMQDALTATGPGDQTLTLSYVPVKNSEHLYWNGLYQPGTEWSRDQWTVTIANTDNLIASGDELVMEYAYRDPAPPPPPPPPTMEFIGYSFTDNHTSALIPLPDGTQQGDFIFIACGTGILAGNQPACHDSRMLIVRTDGEGDGHQMACFGIEDGSGDPVLVEVTDGEFNGTILLATYRCTGYVSTTALAGGSDVVLGSVPGDEPSIGILCVSAGGIAPADDPHEGWAQDAFENGSGTWQMISHNDGTTGFGATSGTWALVAIGLMPGSGMATIPPI